MTPPPLIGADELIQQLSAPRLPAILDVRWTVIGPPGRDAYRAGHIPGAIFADVESGLSRPATTGSGRHPLPDAVALQDYLRSLGVDQDAPVVVYDDSGGRSAARAWWLLRWAGHPAVRLLDGGRQAWVRHGGSLTTRLPRPHCGNIVVRPGAMPTVTYDDILRGGHGTLLDARDAERYSGEHEPVDPVAGHIPGALNAPTSNNLADDDRFLPTDALVHLFAELGIGTGATVAVYCGSGVTAAHQVLALATIGVTASLYPGSWSEWIADPTRPIATGPQPSPSGQTVQSRATSHGLLASTAPVESVTSCRT